MKKLITFILILSLLLPAAVLADGKLGMTMSEFMEKYNAVPAAIGSPYIALKFPVRLTTWNNYSVAWFFPCDTSSTTILLLSSGADTYKSKELSSDLDTIQIFSSDNWVQLLSVATRCVQVFCVDMFGTSMAPLYVTDVVNYYYENRLESTRKISYRFIDTSTNIALSFFRSGDDYYFQIYSREGID